MTSSSQHPQKTSSKSRINLSSVAKMKLHPDTEPDGTADCVHQGNLTDNNNISTSEPTNIIKPLTSDEHNTDVGTSPTKLFKDTPNLDRTIGGFLKPTTSKRNGAKSSKDPISMVILNTFICTSEADKIIIIIIKADLAKMDHHPKNIYEEQKLLPISHQ